LVAEVNIHIIKLVIMRCVLQANIWEVVRIAVWTKLCLDVLTKFLPERNVDRVSPLAVGLRDMSIGG
jgi:hypothetical protein